MARYLLVRHKSLERRHHLRQRHRLVAKPLFVVLGTVEKDDKVVVLTLVVDLELGSLAASHCDWFGDFRLLGLVVLGVGGEACVRAGVVVVGVVWLRSGRGNRFRVPLVVEFTVD